MERNVKRLKFIINKGDRFHCPLLAPSIEANEALAIDQFHADLP